MVIKGDYQQQEMKNVPGHNLESIPVPWNALCLSLSHCRLTRCGSMALVSQGSSIKDVMIGSLGKRNPGYYLGCGKEAFLSVSMLGIKRRVSSEKEGVWIHWLDTGGWGARVIPVAWPDPRPPFLYAALHFCCCDAGSPCAGGGGRGGRQHGGKGE